MISICVLVCANGLGHARRIIPVVHALLERTGGVRVTICCAAWQQAALQRWKLLRALTHHPRATFRTFDAYPRWSLDADYYRTSLLLEWHRSLRELELESYDLVVSDNLVEALIYQPRAMLMGSFLWHDLYLSTWGHEPLVREYADRCHDLLGRLRPEMIANRYFAMHAVCDQTRTIGVGMLPSVLATRADSHDARCHVLAISGGSAETQRPVERFLRDAATLGVPSSIVLHLDRKIAATGEWPAEWPVFEQDPGAERVIDAIVARPGMGVITDAVVSRRPLFCVHEPNPEMEHNMRVLEHLGVGWHAGTPANCFRLITEHFSNPASDARYMRNAAALDANGLSQTVDAILARAA